MKRVMAFIMMLLILTGCSNIGAPRHLAEPADERNPAKLVISGLLPEYSEENMINDSTIIARGTITEKSDAFGVIPVGGGTQYNFTDYSFEILEQIKGENSNKIDVRVLGGTVNEQAPSFEIGNEYLLFLSRVDVGGGYNTVGDYYIVFGANQGAFETSEGDTYYNPIYEETINIDTLKNEMSANPIVISNENTMRGEFIENQRRNLENGFIAHEEYDAAIASLDVYAEIVK